MSDSGLPELYLIDLVKHHCKSSSSHLHILTTRNCKINGTALSKTASLFKQNIQVRWGKGIFKWLTSTRLKFHLTPKLKLISKSIKNYHTGMTKKDDTLTKTKNLF